MNRRFALALLALAFSALPARADGKVGFNFDLRLTGRAMIWWDCRGMHCGVGPGSPGGPSLAPWYMYYPTEAYYQNPAPITYPFWPAPMTPPGAKPTLQPVSYYPTAPAYWYGR